LLPSVATPAPDLSPQVLLTASRSDRMMLRCSSPDVAPERSLARSLLKWGAHLTRARRHPYTIHTDGKGMVKIMADNVRELRPKPSDSEKITINLGYVDLGHVDLMVHEGFYSNRTDFIRTAIRNQLERHADVVKQSTARKSLDLGLRNYSLEDLEAVQRAGEMLHINVLGLASISQDVTPELARATIASVSVLGALHASPAVKAALADRTR
jgi:Arc/MetJ-type ribon-helix-helix transcriptional regulator